LPQYPQKQTSNPEGKSGKNTFFFPSRKGGCLDVKNALGNSLIWHLLWHRWASPQIFFAKRQDKTRMPTDLRRFFWLLTSLFSFICSSELPLLAASPALLVGPMFAAPQDYRLVPRATEARLLGWVYLLPPNCWPSLQYLQNYPLILMEPGMGFLFMG